MAEISPIDVQRALRDAKYPATRKDLVDLARSNDADRRLTEELESLPEDRFNGPDEVTKAVFRH